MYIVQGKLGFHEMILGGSCLRAMWLLHQFWTCLVWSMSLSLEKNLRKAQGEFYIMVFHWCSVKPTCDVSGRYSRADVGMTSTVSASLPMMRPTVDILSRWICACVFYFPYSDCGEYCIYILCCMCLGPREQKLFDLARVNHLWTKRRTGSHCLRQNVSATQLFNGG